MYPFIVSRCHFKCSTAIQDIYLYIARTMLRHRKMIGAYINYGQYVKRELNIVEHVESLFGYINMLDTFGMFRNIVQ